MINNGQRNKTAASRAIRASIRVQGLDTDEEQMVEMNNINNQEASPLGVRLTGTLTEEGQVLNYEDINRVEPESTQNSSSDVDEFPNKFLDAGSLSEGKEENSNGDNVSENPEEELTSRQEQKKQRHSSPSLGSSNSRGESGEDTDNSSSTSESDSESSNESSELEDKSDNSGKKSKKGKSNLSL
ncbi:uncharacterized protein MELLADRAFT_114487 [Melampsora larici-populina 98AG31]|uniref:Uncharacterized protein n=1 Tax=Melampsora larici-populina (strain 98AG31 / pathotype 3-4-7) TaxID=747676 RepID=F4SDN1_MELLP|nr:uncharacterized protein MELLADRAFT_114487 [Melampsora larici-populina 98AG31]EGF97243.1 hypothetical protein MELLADRAFT_114487 [Melampsora larici-populina 98AG31]